MNLIAIDLGGTRIKIGIVSQTGILGTTIIDAYSNKEFKYNIHHVELEIEKILLKNNLRIKDISGIGFSIPGIIDSRKMKLLSVNEKYKDAADFNFIEWAVKKYSLPVYLENDARCALVGEWKYGAGKNYDDIVMITLGTGIGGAALIEGKLVYGKHFQAGCLGGHFIIDFRGSECNCGNIGCVETVASSWALSKQIKNDRLYPNSCLSKSEKIDYHLLFRSAQNGDELAQKSLETSLIAWSSGVINLIHAYDPEIVILGGGIMNSAEIILPFIQDYVDKRAWTPWGKVKVVAAKETNYSALLGVSYLLSNHLTNLGA